MKGKFMAITLLLSLCLLLTACSGKEGPHPDNPVTLTLWHNFGGQMQATMDEQVREFNATVGREQGVILNVTSISGSASLQEKLTMIAAGDPGAPEMPDITTCYPATALLLAEKGLLASIDEYFTAEELSAYLPRFVEEGRLSDGKLYVFPFAKSTEVLFLNQTLFYPFSKETGVTLEQLSTFEGIADAAMKYYAWTDAQTPDTPNDGKEFFATDSLFNLVQAGMAQMGETPFAKEKLRLDAPEFEHIIKLLLEPAVKGGYALYDGYSSDLSKTGDIICSTGSTAGILFYGNEITYADNRKQEVEFTVLPYPTFEGGKKIAIQRGNGMAVAKSTPRKEEAAALFLKWFTSPEQNMRFVASTGYLPVTGKAFSEYLAAEIASNENPNIKKLLQTAMTVHEQYDFYIPPVFDSFSQQGKQLEQGFYTYATAARERYLSLTGESSSDAAYKKAAEGVLEKLQGNE